MDLSRFVEERATVAEICARVLAEGDSALRELGKRFDGWAPGPAESFEVPKAELTAAVDRLAPADRSALEFAAGRIREFHERQVQAAPVGSPGLQLLTRPVRRAGACAPRGEARVHA